MPNEPTTKRTFGFFDGQNLFYAAKEAFGYSYPNYHPRLLAQSICTSKRWNLGDIYFYTGVPAAEDKPFWNHFSDHEALNDGTPRHSHLLSPSALQESVHHAR